MNIESDNSDTLYCIFNKKHFNSFIQFSRPITPFTHIDYTNNSKHINTETVYKDINNLIELNEECTN